MKAGQRATWRTVCTVLCVLGLVACSSAPTPRRPVQDATADRLRTPAPAHETDAYPDDIPDLENIPEPEVREEPRAKYGNPESYTVLGETYRVKPEAKNFVERGIASWYGTKFHGRRTSSGEAYDMFRYTAAHKTLPLPTYVRVTNLQNQKSTVVRVNDRGPFKEGRIIDLSYVAAHKLGLHNAGTAPVEIRVLEPGDDGADTGVSVGTLAPLAAAEPRVVAGGGSVPVAGAAKPPRAAPQFHLQVGAFGVLARAEAQAAEVRKRVAQTVRVEQARSGVHRVRIGPFASRAEAENLLESLDNQGLDAALVVD